MVLWNISMELRLKELAAEGVEGADIASMLSAEFGEVFTVNAVFHKASRLGLALRGRAGSLEGGVSKEDPFGVPSWLMKELAKETEKEGHERPREVVCLGWEESREEITSAMIERREIAAYAELWRDYVENIVRNKKCTIAQAQEARTHIPQWFKQWAEVIVVLAWDLDLEKVRRAEKLLEKYGEEIDFNELSSEEQKAFLEAEEVLAEARGDYVKKFDKTIEEVVATESKGKTLDELKEDAENMEALNKTVSEAQKKAAIESALKEAEK